MSHRPIVRLEGVTKRYSGIAVLEDADFDLYPARFTPSSARTAQASPPCAK